MRDLRSIPALLALLVLFACSDDTPAGADSRGELANSVEVGETFRLSPGQRVAVGDDGLVVGFRGVRDDSRCPTDVECVWSGDAAVVVSVAVGRAASRTITLHTDLEPRAARIGELALRLVSLAPEPVSTRRIEPGAYVAALVVERL